MANQSIEDAVVTWEKRDLKFLETQQAILDVLLLQRLFEMAKELFQLLVKVNILKARFGMGAGPQQLTLNATQTLQVYLSL